MKPPLAASTWSGTFSSRSEASRASSASMDARSSIWPVKVVPRRPATAIVFSSTRSSISLAPIV